MKGIIFGAGYVGRACIEKWPNSQDTFIATTTHTEKVAELKRLTPHVQVIQGNESKKLENLFANSDFAIVCVAPKDRTLYAETYLKTARTLSEILSERKSPFYLLYTSSTSVYGNHEGANVDENSPCRADSENGQILIATEQCFLEVPTIDVCIVRLGGIYGPERDLKSRAERLAGKSLTGRDIPTNNSSLELITNGIAWCVQNRLKGIYNLVEHTHPTRGELYGSLIKEQKLPQPVWNSPHTGGARISNQKLAETGFML